MPDVFSPIDVGALATASRAAFHRIRPLLQARGTQGLVRRGHGDLHLGNIALIEGRPVPFDAIEFDPLIAAGDVLYDLAFLLMDLTGRGLTQAANVVFNRYLAEARRDSDLEALAALPLFMSLRAAIRAKVTAAKLESAKAGERAPIMEAATTYFRLACELITPPAPKLIAVGGLSGTGKSELARALAADLLPAPGAVLLRSDVERKVMFGVAETDRLPAQAYDAAATRKVYGRSPARRNASSRPAIRRSSTRFSRLPRSAPPSRKWAASACAACFSRPTSRRDLNASARAVTMPPMRMRRSRNSRKPMISARSSGPRSTRPARRAIRCGMPGQRSRDDALSRQLRR